MIYVVAAASPVRVAIEKAGKLFNRNPYHQDEPILWEGDPHLGVVALVTKWGYSRVLGKDGKDRTEIGDNQAPILKAEHLPSGEHVYRIVELIELEEGHQQKPLRKVVVRPNEEQGK